MKKIGRPTVNPKNWMLSVRLDEESRRILEQYCKSNHLNKTEAIAIAIKKLEQKENEYDNEKRRE